MSKFIIPKGQSFEATIVIKSKGSPTGEPLNPTDVGEFIISEAYGNMCQLLTIPLVVSDADNGKVSLTMTAEETALLPYDIGNKEDGSKPMQTCKAMVKMPILSGETVTGYIYSVYVYSTGVTCA